MTNFIKTISFIGVLFATFTRSQKLRRICEAQNTCINCGDDHYSYYKCSIQQDCFTNENCTEQGFCCPASDFGITMSSLSNDDFEITDVSAFKYESEKSKICPDGSPWFRKCSIDSDCMPDNEMCAVGKCCSVCSQHRRRILTDLPTTNVVGVHIPRCDSTGKYYRAVQCRAGTEECWCVSTYGRIIGWLKPKTVNGNGACETLRLTVKRIIEEKRRNVEVRRKQENFTSSKQESHRIVISSKDYSGPESQQKIRTIFAGFNDECSLVKSGRCPEQPASFTGPSKFCRCDSDCSDSQKCCPILTGGWVCSANITDNIDRFLENHLLSTALTATTIVCDKNEEFVECVDECKPTCYSEVTFPCFIKRCKKGCQCKSGFIRKKKDVNAPCIPEYECPQGITEIEIRCADPLREYKTCGPACPISCSPQRSKCRAQGCLEGCFCKIPYILENGSDPVHSKCILPIYCPSSVNDYISFGGAIHDSKNFHSFPEHHDESIAQPMVMRCSDPLKNFQICGSGCPVGCNNQIPGTCGSKCVTGCFCRDPYILQDAYNLNSQCILSHQCQTFTTIQQQQQICSDPRKEWTNCFSNECSPSCSNPETKCALSNCSPGCICRKPYLLLDSYNPNSRCVLPSECGSQCSDPLKEYQACATSCPIGCNNRVPQICSPCVSGCFCKSGFLFEDAENWRTSKCIPLNQCPMTNITSFSILFRPESNNSCISFRITASMAECPATTVDLNGKFCNFDSDCPIQQRCCRSNLFGMISTKRSRCTCLDPHAYWDSCGILCPEYCGQPAIPICSATCNPGCHCAYGYVKARNSVMAPCVLRTQCFKQAKYHDNDGNEKRTIATVKMLSDDHKIIGDLKIKEINKERIKLEGEIAGLPIGEHALIVHEAGDISDSCANIGSIMIPDKKFNVSAIFGDIKVNNIQSAIIDREINWPHDLSLIGHSLVIHKFSVIEWSLRNKNVLPLACGTIGFASSS